MRLTDKATGKVIPPTSFEIIYRGNTSGHECDGCYFLENNIDCTMEEVQDYLNNTFRQYPGNITGSCKNLIAKLKKQ